MRQSKSDASSNVSHVINSNIRGSSYIYAPWLASVSGGLGFITDSSRSGSGSGGSSAAKTNSLVGDANVNLFPSSRFPFSANVSRSDSRSSTAITSSDYTNTRLGLNQSYMSEDGQRNSSTSFDHSTISAQGRPNDTVSALSSSYNLPFWGINNSLNTRYSISRRGGTGDQASLFTANSSHSYSPLDNLSLQGFSNYTENNLRYGSGNGSLSNVRGQFLQLGTSASWRPEFEDEEDYPLGINFGASYAGSRTEFGSATAQTQTVSGNTSANYRFSPNLMANGSGFVTQASSGTGNSRLFYGMGSGINYSANPLMIGKFSYNWNTGGGANWFGGTGTEGDASTSNLNVFGSAGHGLNRNFILSARDSVSFSVSQNVSMTQNQSVGSSSSLSSNVTSSYRLGLGEQFNGAVTGTFSDVITSGTNSQHFQAFNLGLSGQGQLNAWSSATMNMNLYWTDQTVTTSSQGGQGVQSTNSQRMNMAGSASYTHNRFVGIPGLRYYLVYTADTLLRDNRLMGDPNAPILRVNHSVDNSWAYRIGRMDLRLSAVMTETLGKKNALLFFQVNRQMGGIF